MTPAAFASPNFTGLTQPGVQCWHVVLFNRTMRCLPTPRSWAVCARATWCPVPLADPSQFAPRAVRSASVGAHAAAQTSTRSSSGTRRWPPGWAATAAPSSGSRRHLRGSSWTTAGVRSAWRVANTRWSSVPTPSARQGLAVAPRAARLMIHRGSDHREVHGLAVATLGWQRRPDKPSTSSLP